MCGIKPVWSSEIEPFPLKVTAARFPDMKQLGSVTDINGAEIEPVDIITFGSPCQDLSVAGKQKGIHDGERSNLFFEAVRIIKEMRDADKANGRSGVDIRPRFAVWENVPGAFSSNKGADFQAVLQAIASVSCDGVSIPRPKKWINAGCVVGNGWSIAWRVYDAQYWGVPQRRKRIYLVADFASERAGEILFEREGVSGDSPQSGTPWEGTAADAERSVGGSDSVKCLNPWDCQSKRQHDIGGAYPTLQAYNGGGGRCDGIVYAIQGNGIDRSDTAGCNDCGWRTEQMYTLNTIDRPAVCFQQNQRDEVRDMGECAGSITANPGMKNQNYLCYPEICRTLTAEHDGSWCPDKGPNIVCYDARGNGDGNTTPTLTGDHQNRVTDYTALCVGKGQLHQTDLGDKAGALNCMHDQQAVVHEGKPPRKYIVRRLTPTECARLQGMPDWWCEGLGGSDSAIYKAYGNGLALPCAYDVLHRIAQFVENED